MKVKLTQEYGASRLETTNHLRIYGGNAILE
jgi:hypothetical protein